ncbi:hypothetical protein VHEMI01430 [[Torrubiella] hemipterigena]|uniref:JmjC domain-containing protein n=1 Tax=[Torrubiella] hemipterigena TaxID=1531966 RepID=A0A0A1ST24_9HYPO|nr:hypothetical protein VHEMI01430 [[Torrubiella] hemipterigena]
MPAAAHPQAKFDPIPPDLDLESLVDSTARFKWAQRVSWEQIQNFGASKFEKLVLIHVIQGGKPLIIEGWDAKLPKDLFSATWLEQTYDKKQENVRDIVAGADIAMTMGHYLRSMKRLTNQWTTKNFRDERRQRLYLKDIDCPKEWHDHLQKIIRPSLFYLNDNNTTHEPGSEDSVPAIAGDLMSSLPEEMRAQNLMCYIGHEGTYTPTHREMCASLGQNIMVEASTDANGEKAGSSIWFMTESNDREVVREYFLSMLGHDIEIEKHFAQINAWKRANFDVHVVEQKAGDFILIPPLAAHQVWNRGTRTMKVAWNRTTAETLELALHEALPKARLVARDEQYKNKALIYYTLKSYAEKLRSIDELSSRGGRQYVSKRSSHSQQLVKDFRRLFMLFTEILMDETFATKEMNVEFLPFDSCITCSYCRSNIFNRFLTCKHCVRHLVNGVEDTYDICMECYVMGRSCACMSDLSWCEQWSWPELIDSYEEWRAIVIKNDGFIDINESPAPVEVARQRFGRKSLAQICQESLKRRPFKDIHAESQIVLLSDSDDNGKKRKSTRHKKEGPVQRCHVCCHKDYSYKVHKCTTARCEEAYCYGVLYRAFDMMPQQVMQDEHWQCPRCRGICNCGGCRRSGNTKNPYTPKNTLLGHDTRRVADDRSVEALIDFRIHNLTWLKAAGEESRSRDSKRMKRLQEAASNAKASNAEEMEQVDHDIANADSAPPPPPTWEPTAPEANGEPIPINDSADVTIVEFNNYPDPALFAQRIGLGYYDVDDALDRILFDPYQMPSSHDLKIDEPEMSEHFRKSIQAARRRAKRLNDDPEYIGPRSHYKKPKTQTMPAADFLASMDPALFDETLQPGEPAAEAAPTATAAPETAEAQPDSEAHQPVLRHTKPTRSYIVEEMEVEVVEERVQPKVRPEPLPETDLVPSIESATIATPKTPKTPTKKQTKSGPVASAKKTPKSLVRSAKRRGRPPKQPKEDEDTSVSKEEQRPPTPETAEPASPVQSAKRGRGRPPKQPRKEEAPPAEDPPTEDPKPTRTPPFHGRARGRPPRGRGATARTPVESNPEAKKASQFMSMAERMALRGRSFRIGT